MKKVARCICYSLLVLSLLLLSGCWDSKEVEDLSIVTAITFDKITENGQDKWQTAARIIKMTGQKGGEQSGQKSSTSDFLIKGTGTTMQEAFADFSKRLPTMIFYQHNSALIIGESAAKEELDNLTEIFISYPGSRPRTYVLVTEGEAFKVIQAEPELATTLAKEIKKLTEEIAQQNGNSYGVTLIELTKRLLKPDRDAVISKIITSKSEKGEQTVHETVVIQGLGVTRKNSFAGWLNEEETLGYLLMVQKLSSAQIPIAATKDGTLFNYWLESSKSSIKSELIEGKLHFTIKIKADGVIYENNGIPLNPEEIPALEEAAGEGIQEIAMKTIAKAKEYDSDFLGLTEEFHRFHPGSWQEIATDWRDRFKDADVKVEVEAKIRNIGAISKKLDIPQ